MQITSSGLKSNEKKNTVCLTNTRWPEERCIVFHLRSATTGLLDGCLLMYHGEKARKNSDYRSELNSHVFLDWLEKKVFLALKKET